VSRRQVPSAAVRDVRAGRNQHEAEHFHEREIQFIVVCSLLDYDDQPRDVCSFFFFQSYSHTAYILT